MEAEAEAGVEAEAGAAGAEAGAEAGAGGRTCGGPTQLVALSEASVMQVAAHVSVRP